MDKCKDYICGFASKFAKNNWHKINKKRAEISLPKDDFIESLKRDFDKSAWFVTEVMHWAMDKDYKEEMEVHQGDGFFVLKTGNKRYVKFILNDYDWDVEFVQPKTKEVVYFD